MAKTWSFEKLHIPLCNNSSNTGVFLLRRLHRNEGDRVASKLWQEVRYKIN